MGYKVYMPFTFRQWHRYVGRLHKCAIFMDMTFGIECVERAELAHWDKIRGAVVAKISSGDCKLVVALYPHLRNELVRLENDLSSPFLNPALAVNMPASIDDDTKERLLFARIRDLNLPCDTERKLVDDVLRNDTSGDVFCWCCNWLVLGWNSMPDPTNIFTHPADAYVPLLGRLLQHPDMGTSVAAVLLLIMLGHARFLARGRKD
jgi:hypothetical protein